jgi:uracil-DNA glycosylase
VSAAQPGLGSLDLPDNRLQGSLADCAATLPPVWRELVQAFLATEVGQHLSVQLAAELAAAAEIYPADPFRALRDLLPDAVRVVILGQDPYHGPGEAQGRAFSVASGVRIPPSLRNIRQELAADLGLALPASGDLSPWCREGVLLLNTSLTVLRDRAGSHARLGWQPLTDAVIAAVAAARGFKVFLLWGAHAQAKASLIEQAGHARHVILSSNHPSPLSARRPPVPFLGSRPFSRANACLSRAGAAPVDWSLLSDKA